MSPLIERTRSPERDTVARDRGDRRGVQHVGDVVADPGQRAEVDLGEAERGGSSVSAIARSLGAES